MNAYKRHGMTWTDVTDRAYWGEGRKRFGKEGRLAGNATYLGKASDLRLRIAIPEAKRFADGDYRTVEDFKRLAAGCVAKATEWRLELQGAL